MSNISENKIIKKKTKAELYSENGRLLQKAKNINNINKNFEAIQRYYYEKDSSCEGINGYNYNNGDKDDNKDIQKEKEEKGDEEKEK